jgi:hypothetical protein
MPQPPRRLCRNENKRFYSRIFDKSDLDDLTPSARIGANEPNIRRAKPERLSKVAPQ